MALGSIRLAYAPLWVMWKLWRGWRRAQRLWRRLRYLYGRFCYHWGTFCFILEVAGLPYWLWAVAERLVEFY